MRKKPEITGSAQPSQAKQATIYRVGEIVIDARRGFIRRAGAEDLYLRHQTFQVLLYLLARRDRVVTKDELHRAIWDRAAVTDDALVKCVVDIRKALGDESRQRRVVKTISRSGYRFVAAVEELSADEPSVEVSPAAPELSQATPNVEVPPVSAGARTADTPSGYFRVLGAVTAVMILAIVSTLWSSRSQVATDTTLTATPGLRRVVVFYFENQSSSKEFDWLRQGLADMVITGLARSEHVAVLGRQQLELLLERNGVDRERVPSLDRALELARQSGAESIVLGSFAEIGGSIRFEARLHDARDGRMLSVESAVSQQPNEVLSNADLMTLRIASRLGVDALARDTGKITQVATSSLEAYRHYLSGLEKSEALHSIEAIRSFETALRLDPTFAMAAARIGYAYVVAAGLPEQAKPYLQKAFEQTSRLSEKERSYIAVWSALANLDYPQAIDLLNDIVRRYPLDVEAWWRLGAVLHGEARSDEARTALQRGLAADPYHRQMTNTLGTVYQTLARHDEAIAMHRRYTQLAPNEANAYDSLGLSYQYAGRYGEAIEAYRRAIALEPAFEIAIVHLGNTFYQLGRYREAIEQYRRYIEAAEYDRDRARGHSAIAWVEWRRSRHVAAESAAATASRISDIPPSDLSIIALSRGHLGEARSLRQRSRQGTTRGAPLTRRFSHYFEGEIALHENRFEDAIASFKEALAHPPAPWHVEPHDDCLASAWFRLGRFEEAAAEYRRVLTINPNLGRPRYALAQALDRLNQKQAAREEYGRFLAAWKDADHDLAELAEAKRRLAALTAAEERP